MGASLRCWLVFAAMSWKRDPGSRRRPRERASEDAGGSELWGREGNENPHVVDSRNDVGRECAGTIRVTSSGSIDL